MFSKPQLRLPEHVRITLDPNPQDGGRTFLLVITGSADPSSDPFHLSKSIPRDIGALAFGKDLMNAINHISDQLSQRSK